MNRLGLTSAVDAGGGGHVFPKDYAGTDAVVEQGKMAVRIGYYLFPQTAGKEAEDFLEWTAGYQAGNNADPHLDHGFELEGAGEFLAHSAGDWENFLAPRPDLDERKAAGQDPEGDLHEVVTILVKNNWPLRQHATYGESIAHIMNVFERVKSEQGRFVPRWAIDHAETRTLVESTLTSAGYEVRTVIDGAEALQRLLVGEARMVVSDWEMPGLSGLDLCRKVRGQDLPNCIYFILVTGHNQPEERVARLRAGENDFIAKPFNPAELIERVRAGERILAVETRDVAIFAMAKLAESRDPETGAHLERVRSYGRVLAQDLSGVEKFRDRVAGEFIRLIYLTSPLPDIGKVGIPDYVLLNPGRLNDRELEIMKTHAALGAETLDAALRTFPGVEFLQMGRDIAATHHERWNGKGYPAGLRGENIPLCGRIVAVADVYDALTSRRVYKAAFSHDIAKAMILKDSGEHFDPDIVAAFLRCEQRFVEIRDRHAEPHAMAA